MERDLRGTRRPASSSLGPIGVLFQPDSNKITPMGRCPPETPGCKEIHTTLKSLERKRRGPLVTRYPVVENQRFPTTGALLLTPPSVPPHRRKNALSMAKSLTFSMAIDIQRAEVLLPTDRSDITTKTNVNRTNKPSTKTGHLQTGTAGASSTPRPVPPSANTRSDSAPQPAPKKIPLHRQLSDLRMQIPNPRFVILLALRAPAREHLLQSLHGLTLPVAHLARMHLVLGCNRLNRVVSSQRIQRHSLLELCRESSPSCGHSRPPPRL